MEQTPVETQPEVTQTPRPEAQPVSPVSSKPKNRLSMILGILVILLSLGAVAFLTFQNMQLKNQLAQKNPTPTPTLSTETDITPAPDPTADWKTYTSQILGVTFKLPPKLSLQNLSGIEKPGETGLQYCMIFVGSLSFSFVPKVHAGGDICEGGQFNVGAVSKNYSAGREGTFSDYTGYVKTNNLYYPRFLYAVNKTALPANITKEITNPNGVTYLRIKGENSMQDYGGEQIKAPTLGTPGEGYIGALFNIQNDRYSGFNVHMPIASPSDETIFDQILSTFEFTDQETIPPISSQELDMGWYYGNNDKKKPNTPAGWIYEESGRSSCWHKPEIQCGYLPD